MTDLLAIVALIRDDIGQEELAVTLRREILQLAWRLRAILRTHRLTAMPGLPSAALPSVAPLRTGLDDIAARITGLQAEVNSPQRAALIAERDGLTERKWFGVVKADVLA